MIDRKIFYGKTLAEAKTLADGWFAKQIGLVRISDYSSPINLLLVTMTEDRWLHTIVYRKIEAPNSN